MSYQQIAIVVLFSACFGSFHSTSPLLAQITPDRTLGNETSVVTPNLNIKDTPADLIEGGAIRENNLFHSFAEFNIPNGHNVYFASPEGIANILSRVTGNNISEIFGTLGVDGAANLFLLNPNGIVFGEDAVLDINGSFFATTAESYIFENDAVYSATNSDAPPLLTVNIPVGIQFGDRAETIVVETQSPNFNEEFNLPIGMAVPPGKNITLVGGDLEFKGTNLSAPNGKINLGSVALNSLVEIVPTDDDWVLDYGKVSTFQDISLTPETLINSSGDGTGTIEIQADSVQVESSFIYADAEEMGDAEGIKINVKTLSLWDDAGIASNTFSESDSGNISIQADSLEVESSFISSESLGDATGNGGDINLNVGTLSLLDGTEISSDSSNEGDSGNIFIQADFLEVKSSFISSDSFRDIAGNGGDINLNVGTFSLLDGTEISSDSISEGDAGNISIQADSLEVKSSFISSDSFADAAGKGGDINLNVRTFSLLDGAVISSDTVSDNDAGDISIQANFLEIKGVDEFGSGSRISSGSSGIGNGGDINLNVGTLSLLNGADISSGTSSRGDAGNISIQANSIELKGENQETDFSGKVQYLSSGIFSSATGEDSTGNGGKIDINVTEAFNISDGGKLQTDTDGFGSAGNIQVDVFVLNISGSGAEGAESLSQISALSGKDGDSGSIAINSNTLHISDRGNISVSNLGNGNSGSLSITTSQLYLDDFATIEAKVSKGSQGNIQLTTDNIFLNNHSEITVLATGSAMGGNLGIDNAENIVLLKNSQIIADSIEGNGGNININTQGYFISADSSISASSDFGLDGNIEVETINGDRTLELAALPNNPINGTEKITAGCNSQNNFAIAGKGGLPANPNEYLRGQAVWQDLRLLEIDSITILKKDFQREITRSESPMEANDWKINNLGKVELIVGNSSDIASKKNHADCSLWN